jgi:DNA-binding transcriptional LysR family regulator
MLVAEPSYASEAFLITPWNHPLAKRRTVHPRDLVGYPLVNSPSAYPSSNVRAVLDRYDVFQADYLVQVDYTASIRRMVELGCGIGLIYAVPSVKPPSDLHERSMSRYFDDVSIRVIRRQGGIHAAAADVFIEFVRMKLGRAETD